MIVVPLKSRASVCHVLVPNVVVPDLSVVFVVVEVESSPD